MYTAVLIWRIFRQWSVANLTKSIAYVDFCRSRLFRLLKFDRLADTSCKSPMDETVGCNSRNDGYFQLTQEEVSKEQYINFYQ